MKKKTCFLTAIILAITVILSFSFTAFAAKMHVCTYKDEKTYTNSHSDAGHALRTITSKKCTICGYVASSTFDDSNYTNYWDNFKDAGCNKVQHAFSRTCRASNCGYVQTKYFPCNGYACPSPYNLVLEA